jgi:hypothetical protein
MGPTVLRLSIRALLLALVATFAAGGLQSAQAATTWSYMAYAGATQVKVLDNTVSSDYTAPAYIYGAAAGMKDANSTARVDANGVASVGAVETKAESFETARGIGTRTVSQVADVNLLGGLITADALKTTVTSHGNDDGSSSATGGTEFVNLKIVGVDLPVNIPKNFSVRIPGVAEVYLDYFATSGSPGNRGSMATALTVHLLKSAGQLDKGATVAINPALTFLGPGPDPDEGANLGGNAYGTKIRADVGDGAVKVISSPTAAVRTKLSGSQGETITNATASAKVPGVADVGVIKSTTTSSKDTVGNGKVVNTNEVAGINLLGGLITADAIKVTARSERVDGEYTGSMKLDLVNLTIAGNEIAVNVSPNTVINVANLGKVVINEQTQKASGNRIRALSITLDTSRAGLPVGAQIEVAVAATRIN